MLNHNISKVEALLKHNEPYNFSNVTIVSIDMMVINSDVNGTKLAVRAA